MEKSTKFSPGLATGSPVTEQNTLSVLSVQSKKCNSIEYHIKCLDEMKTFINQQQVQNKMLQKCILIMSRLVLFKCFSQLSLEFGVIISTWSKTIMALRYSWKQLLTIDNLCPFWVTGTKPIPSMLQQCDHSL